MVMPAIATKVDENREERRWEVGCPLLIAANKDFFFPLVIVEEEEDKEEDLFCEEEEDKPR
jgi:hypothetical protein